MNDEAEQPPTSDEVLEALDQILASPQFKTSATQSGLLSFVVQKALAKEEIKAIHIMSELYGDSNLDIHRVKSTANLVRDKLAEYHASEGRNSLVRIELPPGPGYRPQFTYNFDSFALRELQRANVAGADITAQALTRARFALDMARSMEPRYIPIYEALAENGLLRLIVDQVFNGPEPKFLTDLRREESAWFSDKESWRTAETLNAKSWRAALARGWLLGLGGEWELARRAFAKALDIDAESVNKSLSYAGYLIFMGKSEKGQNIVRQHVMARPNNLGDILLAGFLDYLARRSSRADLVLSSARTLVGHSDLREVIAALVRLETTDCKPAGKALAKIEGSKESQDQTPLPGLVILYHVRAGEMDIAREKWEAMRHQSLRKPLQFAIAHMALGSHDEAVEYIQQASDEGDFFTNLIHVMPLFDPLRTHPRFAEMVRSFQKRIGIQLP